MRRRGVRLAAHAAELVAKPEPVILAGDYNIIPEERDVYRPESWAEGPGELAD